MTKRTRRTHPAAFGAKSGPGGGQAHAGRTGAAVRCASEPDHGMETAVAGVSGRRVRCGLPVWGEPPGDVKTLRARIGPFALSTSAWLAPMMPSKHQPLVPKSSGCPGGWAHPAPTARPIHSWAARQPVAEVVAIGVTVNPAPSIRPVQSANLKSSLNDSFPVEYVRQPWTTQLRMPCLSSLWRRSASCPAEPENLSFPTKTNRSCRSHPLSSIRLTATPSGYWSSAPPDR